MNQTTKMATAIAALLTGVAILGSQPLPNSVQAAEPVVIPTPGGDNSSGYDSSVIPTATFAYIPTATPTIMPTATPTPVAPLPVPKSSERGTIFFSSVTDAGVDASPLTGRIREGAIYDDSGFSYIRLQTRQGAPGGLVRILDVSLYVQGQPHVGQQFRIVPDVLSVRGGASVLYTQARSSYNRVHNSQSGSVTVAAVKCNRIRVQLNNVRLQFNGWAPQTGDDFALNGTLDVKAVPSSGDRIRSKVKILMF